MKAKKLLSLRSLTTSLFLMFGMFVLNAQVQMDLPVNFEGSTIDYGLIGFDGAEASTIEVDPTDAANTVVKVIKSAAAQTWAGTTVTAPAELGFASAIPFTVSQTKMSVRVWSPDAGIQVRLKVEDHSDPTISVETEATTTVANGWQTLVFNFANQSAGTAALNLANTYDKATVFFNFGVNGATAGVKTYYFDDMMMFQPTDLIITTAVCDAATEVRLTGPFWGWDPTAGPVAVNNGNGTFTFTLAPAPTANMEYLLIVDGVQENLISAMQNGGTCAPITDYANYANRIWNTTDPLDVANTYGQCTACTPTVSTDLVITTTVCTTATTVRLTGPFWSWDPTAGPVAVNNGNGTFTFTFAPAPTANMEYLLIVDGVQENLISAMQNGGTCAPVTDYANYANRIWNTTDALTVSNTYGQCGACSTVNPNQMVLPVTFEGSVIEYGVIGFEGAEASTIEVDPTDATNTVVKVIKVNTAQPWAGTTVTAPEELGFASAIPFSTTHTQMSVRVWSPDAGIVVRLKVESHLSPTISVETDATTTVANGWETLVFDFANEATGTAALNLANTYDKASIFFNYGVNGATAGEKTYYFDDIEMYNATSGDDLLITVDVCSTTANEVRLTGPFWSWDPTAGPTAVNNGDGTWTFTFAPAPTTDMEYLIIVDGVQENLIADMQNGGTCAPVTDYFAYANRKWVLGSGDVNISYDRCVSCSYPDLVITTEVCDGATQVNLTGPIWGWNPAFGPQAVDNGNGTWTFTISPAPNDTLEYLLVKNGTVENLIQEMVNGGGCAPITDYATYANRRWLLGQGDVANTYGKCGSCIVGIDETSFENLMVYPNPSSAIFTVSNNTQIEKVTLYSIIGEKVLEKSIQSMTSTLDLSAMASGIYHLNIQVGGETKTIQLIKE